MPLPLAKAKNGQKHSYGKKKNSYHQEGGYHATRSMFFFF